MDADLNLAMKIGKTVCGVRYVISSGTDRRTRIQLSAT